MADVVKREKLDILHVHYAIPHAVCAILAKQMSGNEVKIVTTLAWYGYHRFRPGSLIDQFD